jgi:hypothetical protein
VKLLGNSLRAVIGWPLWAKIAAAVGFVSAVLGVVGFLVQMGDRADQARDRADQVRTADLEKTRKFDAVYREAWSRMGSEFMSSHNYLLTVIPQFIAEISDQRRPDWERVSYSWNKHGSRINSFYQELARCLDDGTCKSGDETSRACESAVAEMRAHRKIHQMLEGVQGINLDYTGGNTSFGGAFGPSVSVPNMRSLELVVAKACDLGEPAQ